MAVTEIASIRLKYREPALPLCCLYCVCEHFRASAEKNGEITPMVSRPSQDMHPYDAPRLPDGFAYLAPRSSRLWQALRSHEALIVAASIAVGLLALLLFINNADQVSLWGDETYSLAYASLPLSVFASVHETNMLLYYLLLHSWLNITGLLGILPFPLVARLPSIVAMVFAAVVISLLGSRFWNLTAGAMGGVFFVLNALILQQAQQARGYALLMLLTCLAWYALLSALKDPANNRWWIAYTLMSVFAIYTQILAVFMVVAQVLTVLILLLPPVARRAEDFPLLSAQGWRVYRRPGSTSLAVIVAAFVPLAYDSIQHHGDISWVPTATPSALWAFVMAQTNDVLAAVAFIAAIALGGLLGLSVRRGFPIILLMWGIIPIAIQYVLSQPTLNLHFFYPRYLITSLPALALLAALGVTGLRPKWGAIALTLALLVLFIQIPGSYYPYSEVQPFMETTQWMEARYKTGDGIICRPATNNCGVPIGYHLRHLYTGSQQMPVVFPGDYVWDAYRSTPTDPEALTPYLASRQRVFVFTVAPIGGDPNTVQDDVPATLEAAGFKLIATYRPADQGARGDVEVAEYDR